MAISRVVLPDEKKLGAGKLSSTQAGLLSFATNFVAALVVFNFL